MTNYSQAPGQYDEAEGIFPDGKFNLLIGFFNADTLNEWRTPNTIVLRLNGRGDRFLAGLEYLTGKWRVGSLAGHGLPGTLARDAVPDHAKRFYVGHLARNPKNAEGLASILEGFFGLPARVDQFVLGWLELPRDQRTVLGGQPRPSGTLGLGTVIGERVRDVQSRFRAVMGPMDLDRFCDFLPGGRSLERLKHWVRNYVGFEFDWDVQLVLARDEVPGIRLGREGQLGWTTWLGARRAVTDADDLTLVPERTRPPRTNLAAA